MNRFEFRTLIKENLFKKNLSNRGSTSGTRLIATILYSTGLLIKDRNIIYFRGA